MSYYFISYRYKEKDFAIQVVNELQKAGVNIWMDILNGIKIGDDWRTQLQDGINKCSGFIALISRSYIASKFCKREIMRADELGKTIFPVIIEDVPKKELPIVIQEKQCLFLERKNSTEFTESIKKLLLALDTTNVDNNRINLKLESEVAFPFKAAEEILLGSTEKLTQMKIGSIAQGLRFSTLKTELDILQNDYESLNSALFEMVDPTIKNIFLRKMNTLIIKISDIEKEIEHFS